MPQKFYLTTPIYYVNATPHIGHAYTTIAADVLARYKRQQGFEVHFLTGTDEHGQKVWKMADSQGKPAQQFADEMVAQYKSAWAKLNIQYDDFIRTTEERHKKCVQNIFHQLLQKGDIYKGEYEGWYCIPCETFWAEGELNEDLEGRKLCPDCGRVTDLLKEETYFFKLSKYQDAILKHIEATPDFIQPAARKNEIIQFIKQGLKDLSVTRTAFPWGIVVPDDPKHVVYVWFDALINYVSAIGYSQNKASFDKWWPADVHLMGKEIVRFHSVTWPAMLLALDLPLPKKVFGHGWWTVEGEKMSKSKGNVVDPVVLAEQYGVDAVRYFILREVAFGADGDFSLNSFVNRFNADLANDLGNLLSRTLTMIEKYFEGKVPQTETKADELTANLQALTSALPQSVDKALNNLAFSDALAAIWELVNRANIYIEKQTPWAVAKQGDQEKLAMIMQALFTVLKAIQPLIASFMPETSARLLAQLNIKGDKVAKGEPLFPRIAK